MNGLNDILLKSQDRVRQDLKAHTPGCQQPDLLGSSPNEGSDIALSERLNVARNLQTPTTAGSGGCGSHNVQRELAGCRVLSQGNAKYMMGGSELDNPLFSTGGSCAVAQQCPFNGGKKN